MKTDAPEMKSTNSNTNDTKGVKEVYNLIVLDRSGSMETIRNQAIAGVNETIGAIRVAAKENGVRQYVTLTSFCGCSTNDFCVLTPVEDVRAMETSDYKPCCMTPLYDALGDALMKLREHLKGRTDMAVSVTVITDGYENASQRWSQADIRSLIKLLTADGWLFAYIGANQDITAIKHDLAINNTLAFASTAEGTREMFRHEREARMRWNRRVSNEVQSANCNEGYFDEN